MQPLTLSVADVQEQTFIQKVYGWMALALIITAGVASLVASSTSWLNAIVSHSLIFYGLLLVEIALVFGLTASLPRLSPPVVLGGFLLYSALNGLTLATLFALFSLNSIGTTFLVTALLFGIMSVYGAVTKQDLTTVGNLALMGLVGIILASLINLFLRNSAVYWISTYIGILVFIGLTAYDSQKIKVLSRQADDADSSKKQAVIGALALYLDFINLFLELLRLFGRKKD